ncbi:MAG: 30S ribosomal protein S16 [Candidatus Omnitrophica bacterium]|nr:30S ribosomal protein S16 [Candidatus Omnitrophota bacterium]
MSVAIRLRRTGTIKKAHWQMVAAHKLTKRNGRYLELLGFYDPGKEPARIELKADRVRYWLEQGAIPSQGALNLIKKTGIKTSR